MAQATVGTVVEHEAADAQTSSAHTNQSIFPAETSTKCVSFMSSSASRVLVVLLVLWVLLVLLVSP